MGDGKTAADIRPNMKEAAEAARLALMEAAAEGEDALLEKYLESGSLSDEELMRGLKQVIHSGAYFPVLCAAGGRSIGLCPCSMPL